MVSSFISRLVILIFGTLYPAYASYKAVRTKNVKEYVKWMMYWIVFALFTCFETLTDLFLSFWFPFYYELKIITVIYLLSPATNGSSILYRKFVHPVLTKREQEIDDYIAKAKEQGYHTMLNLGSKGVTYATSLIMQTAIKGGGGLVSHLRKSYSLSDLSEEQTTSSRREARDEVDRRYYEEYKAMRRSDVHTPRRMISGSGDPGLYFSEVDTFQRPVDFENEALGSRMASVEEISSGYSSGDPLYNGFQLPKGDNLVRTGSLGGSSRMRTRATSRAAIPKRSSLSEGGSSWSSDGLNESQTETDEYFFLPLSHSSSVPLSMTALNRIIQFEYQRMYGGMNQEQLIAFLNSTNLTPPFKNSVETVDSKSDLQEFPNGEIKDVTNAISVVISEVDNNHEKSQSAIGLDENNLSLTEIKESSPENKTGEKEEISRGGNLESEKVPQDRSGKYNKKRAPTPPVESTNLKSNITVAVEQDDDIFCTPDSSPKMNRKLSSSYSNMVQESLCNKKAEVKTEEGKNKLLEVPKKGRSKAKILSKKLHLPKMSFSFWNQKNSKLSSGSENSSTASTENIASAADCGGSNNKNDLEYFVPLKGDFDDDKREVASKEL